MKIKEMINYNQGDGWVLFTPENFEDVWYLYNIILPGD